MAGLYDPYRGWRNWTTCGIAEVLMEDEGFTVPGWKWWCAGGGMTREEAEDYIAGKIEEEVREAYEDLVRTADWIIKSAVPPAEMLDIDYHAIARAVMDDYEDIVDSCSSRRSGGKSDTRSASKNGKASAKKKSAKGTSVRTNGSGPKARTPARKPAARRY